METIIADTGPLVAYLDQEEEHHEWVRATLAELSEPMLTCDAVLVETAFVLNRKGLPAELAFKLLAEELVTTSFEIVQQRRELTTLMRTCLLYTSRCV